MTSGEKMIWAAAFVSLLGQQYGLLAAASGATHTVKRTRSLLASGDDSLAEDNDVRLMLNAMLRDD